MFFLVKTILSVKQINNQRNFVEKKKIYDEIKMFECVKKTVFFVLLQQFTLDKRTTQLSS